MLEKKSFFDYMSCPTNGPLHYCCLYGMVTVQPWASCYDFCLVTMKVVNSYKKYWKIKKFYAIIVGRLWADKCLLREYFTFLRNQAVTV